MKIKINQPYSFYQLGRRDNQEDARFPDSDKPENPLPFFVVCDGVGGLDKGEVASRTVCESFEETLSEFDWSEKLEVSDFENALGKAYEALSDVVNSSTKDMATTMTFVGFHRGGATMAHIGDSRIYHIRPEVGIMYRSDDHSLVNALVRSGNITAEQFKKYNIKNRTIKDKINIVMLGNFSKIKGGEQFINIVDNLP